MPKILLGLMVILPGLLAYGHILYLIDTATANCLSHDYAQIVPLVGNIATSGYNWANFISDSSVGPHCLAPSIITHFLLGSVTNWNAQAELYFGTFLIFLRCLIFVDCMPKTESIWTKLFFLTGLLTLNFGTCCTSTLLFGNPCISASIGWIFFAIGLWAILKLESKSIIAKALMLIGGLVCASYGKLPTLLTWGLYTVAARVAGVKSKINYILLALGAGLSIAQVLSMKVTSLEGTYGIRPRIFINVLGRSFTNNTGLTTQPIRQGEIVCLMLFVFLLLVSYGLWKNRANINIKSLAVPFTLLAYGLVGSAAISFGRDYVGSWYSQFAVLCWTGLLGASAVLMFARPLPKPFLAVAIMPYLFCSILYLQTNIEHRDKDFYRRVHAPSSESMLRHAAIAPTFAESAIFATEVGDVDQVKIMSAPLLKRHWSIFAPAQVWRLQGDFLLPLVTLHEQDGKPRTSWILDKSTRHTQDFRTPEHLNLCIANGNSVDWQAYIPNNLAKADLETAIAAMAGEGSKSTDGKCRISIFELKPETKTETLLESHDLQVTPDFSSVKISLLPYQNKLIKISFIGVPVSQESEQQTVFKHPLIRLDFTDAYKLTTDNPTQRPGTLAVPSNTEKSEYFPHFSSSDLVFTPTHQNWKTTALIADQKKTDGSMVATGGERPSIDINCAQKTKQGLQFPKLGDFSDICLEIAKPADDPYRLVCIQLTLDNNHLTQAVIPLLKDGDKHTYSYETRLFGQPPESQITGIKILPTYLQTSGNVNIYNFRLVRKPINGVEARHSDAQ